MPLTPAAQAIMSMIEASFPPLDNITPETARAAAAMNSAPLEQPDPRLQIEDRLLERTAGTPLAVRLVRPSGATRPPAIIFFHGGGFVLGDLDQVEGYCRALCLSSGAAVIAIDYRLAPEHPFPAAAEDAEGAVQLIVRHAETLEIDATRLAVGGDSAGGNLAAVAAISARQAGSPPLRHQLLLYPVTDLSCSTPSYDSYGEGYFLTRGLMEWFRAQYLRRPEDRDDPRASPLKAPSLAGVAPATIIIGEYDPLRSEGEAYAARLAEAGVPVLLKIVPGVFHGFASILGHLPEADAAMALAGERLREAFA